MSDPWWQSVQGRVRRWLADWLRAEPFEASDFRPRIRFGPDSAVTSSPASWLSAAQLRAQPPPHPPRDREREYDRLTTEIARLTRRDERPPVA
jgi:hypothetical protein